MSKAVLISIRPQWCEKIASGEKTIEVRKTKPKLETPFKCYIYCTLPRYPHEDFIRTDYPKPQFHGGGKVIGEFTCDRIDRVNICGFWDDDGEQLENRIKETCLTPTEVNDYLGTEVGYGWHISGLKIYDTTKELSEFKGLCKVEADCCACPHYNYSKMDCDGRTISRPPQSWCYVEEIP